MNDFYKWNCFVNLFVLNCKCIVSHSSSIQLEGPESKSYGEINEIHYIQNIS